MTDRDWVVSEVPLTIFLNDYELATLLCTPYDLEALIHGFLAAEGLISSARDVKSLVLSHNNTVAQVRTDNTLRLGLVGKRTLTSGCGGGVTFYNIRDCSEARQIAGDFSVSANHILDCMIELQANSPLFAKTGGAHGVALADQDGICFVAEDIGRHNAVDKVIGRAMLAEMELSNKILLASGRISSDMALKALKRGIPVIASRAAPTELAVRMAVEKEMTLIGFVRGRRMNIYSGIERIRGS